MNLHLHVTRITDRCRRLLSLKYTSLNVYFQNENSLIFPFSFFQSSSRRSTTTRTLLYWETFFIWVNHHYRCYLAACASVVCFSEKMNIKEKHWVKVKKNGAGAPWRLNETWKHFIKFRTLSLIMVNPLSHVKARVRPPKRIWFVHVCQKHS